VGGCSDIAVEGSEGSELVANSPKQVAAVGRVRLGTSGTALTWFRTLIGNPSHSRITNVCPAASASAFVAASSVNSASLPDRRTSLAADASQNASPKRRCGLEPDRCSDGTTSSQRALTLAGYGDMARGKSCGF
jgi:hypothetical protein